MPSEKRERSKDFRFIFANAFNVKFSDNDVALTLANQHVFGGEKDTTYVDEAVLMMTPKTAKLLARILNNIVSELESQIGPIALAPETDRELERIVLDPKKMAEVGD